VLSSLDSITYRNRMFRLEPSDWAHETMGGCGNCRTRQEMGQMQTWLNVPEGAKIYGVEPVHLRYGKTTL
jgi:hypothetical protein